MIVLSEAAALPPLAIALALAWPRARGTVLALASWAALPALVVALFAPTAHADYAWLLFGVRFVLDSQNRVLLGVTAAIWLSAGIYGARYLADDAGRVRYTAFFLAAMCGNLGLVLAHDFASFYTLFALMSFASYGLVIHSGDDKARHAGRVYIALVIVGELLLFAGFVLLFAHGSATTAAAPQLPAEHWAAPLLFAGFGIKAGILPLHVWLPLAYPVAPTPASAVLSGAMINAGLIGWLRFMPVNAATAESWGLACAMLGIAAALYGVLIGLTQRDPKVVLAYSSVSQMGLITVAFGLALLAPDAGLPVVLGYAAHHGLAKAALFLSVGLQAAAVTRVQRALLLAGVAIAALALAGAPATTGAMLKSALGAVIDASGSDRLEWLPALLSVAAVGTTLLMARFVGLIASPPDHARRAGPAMWVPWSALLAALVTGVWWTPGTADWSHALTLSKVGASAWPVAAGLAIAALAHRFGRRAHFPLPAVPQGDVVVFFVPAVSAVWRALEAINAAIAAADAALIAVARALRLPHMRLARIDFLLTTSPVAGLLLLAVVALLLW